jgi:hypothetical protein
MLLEPGSVAFVISSDYVYGGYPVVVIEEDISCVAPFKGAWIETIGHLSPPSRGCGLKRNGRG